MTLFKKVTSFFGNKVEEDSPLGRRFPLYKMKYGLMFFIDEEGRPLEWFSESGESTVAFSRYKDLGRYIAIGFKNNRWKIYHKDIRQSVAFTTGGGKKIYFFKEIFSYNNEKNEVFVQYKDGQRGTFSLQWLTEKDG